MATQAMRQPDSLVLYHHFYHYSGLSANLEYPELGAKAEVGGNLVLPRQVYTEFFQLFGIVASLQQVILFAAFGNVALL